MVERGELDTRGRCVRPNFHRAAIETARHRGPAISLAAAASILGRSRSFVQDLIATGEPTSFSNPKWPVFRLEVEGYAQAHPPPPADSPPADRLGQLNTRGAGEVLGLGVDRVKQLARAGLIPSDPDERGHYWFRGDHLASYMRAKAAAAAAEYFSALPRTGQGSRNDD
ncbi:hypothetical protein AB0E63_28045 [Kribbella sp. NPDC026596]|uniref:hypothetical protein n=1 Tax=Kribbella sp. NPDC026596 TaxID=3155122 RepID=UPI0033F961CE